MEEIQQLWDSAKGGHGYLVALTAWMAMARIVMKFFSQGIHDWLATSADETDAAWVNKLLKSRWYRIAAFLLDYLASTKLPTIKPPTPDRSISDGKTIT